MGCGWLCACCGNRLGVGWLLGDFFVLWGCWLAVVGLRLVGMCAKGGYSYMTWCVGGFG